MTDPYIEAIRREDSPGLLTMYLEIAAQRSIPGWPPGRAFEYLILRAFELAAAEVTWPFPVKLEGSVVEQIDGAVRTDRLYMLVESKHYSDRVNIEPIAKIRFQLSRPPVCAMASVFSLQGFTEEAKVLARHSSPLNVLLWEGAEVERMLTDALANPSRVLEGVTHFGLTVVEPWCVP